MTEGQKYLFKLFKEVDSICRKNNIRYYLAGGTLIGAIRHRGFVPWDDDFDLYMTRDEFQKFVSIAQNNGLPANRVLECQEINREYKNIFARYTDVSTSAIHKNQLISDDIAGEVLDILQLDPVPNDVKIHKKHFKRLMLYGDLINPSAPYGSRCEWNRFIYPFCKKIEKLFGKEYILRKVEKELFKYKEDECETYIMRWPGAPLIFKKDLFEPALEVEYEGIKATIPRCYNQYLIDHYGDDWMYIPQVDQQLSHEAVHSLKYNYNVIRAAYFNVIERDKIRQDYEVRKISILKSAKRSHYVADKIVKLRGERIKTEIEKKIENEKIEIQTLYKNMQYEKLESLFSNFYKFQGHAQFSGRDNFASFYRFQNPILIELNDTILEIALRTQNDIGKTGKAYRTLEIYEEQKGLLTEGLNDLKEIILLQRRAMNSYSLCMYEEACKLSNRVLEKAPNSTFALKVFIASNLKVNNKSRRVKEMIDRGQKLFPKDGDFIKYEGDFCLENDKERAFQLYIQARNKTRNGCILLEIDDSLEEYARELTEKMIASFRKNEVALAKRYHNQILEYKTILDIEYVYYEELLNTIVSSDQAYEVYCQLKELVKKFKDSKIEELLNKALIFSGELPVVSQLHTKSIILSDWDGAEINELKEEILDRINYMKSNDLNEYENELLKILADIFKLEGNIEKAYGIYREIYNNLQKKSVAKQELNRMFEIDISKIHEMRTINNENDAWRINLQIKFGSIDFYEYLKNYLNINMKTEGGLM